MKRSELKNIIKECVKEVLFEEGVLSNLVAEVAFGITKAQNTLTEQKQPRQNTRALEKERQEQEDARRKKLLETKRKMLDVIGNDKMSNVFEGTQPLQQSSATGNTSVQGPMAGIDPKDAGVDISGLFSLAGKKWNALK
jgi:hypothetical protein